jgi:hypothetical protein
MKKRERMMKDLEEDIREHIETETQDNIARGMSPEEAHYAAMRKFGNVMRVEEDTRDVWLEQFGQDIHYAFRMLRKSRGFTAVAVLTLALAIGATTAIFSVVYGVLLQPLPYTDSNRIMSVFEVNSGGTWSRVADPNFDDFRDQSRSFQSIRFGCFGADAYDRCGRLARFPEGLGSSADSRTGFWRRRREKRSWPDRSRQLWILAAVSRVVPRPRAVALED